MHFTIPQLHLWKNKTEKNTKWGIFQILTVGRKPYRLRYYHANRRFFLPFVLSAQFRIRVRRKYGRWIYYSIWNSNKNQKSMINYAFFFSPSLDPSPHTVSATVRPTNCSTDIINLYIHGLRVISWINFMCLVMATAGNCLRIILIFIYYMVVNGTRNSNIYCTYSGVHGKSEWEISEMSSECWCWRLI